MENQHSPLGWSYYFQEEGIEELKHSLLYKTLELETTILTAHQESARKEEELVYLKDLLTMTIRERNEAQAKCQRLMSEKFILQQQLQQREVASLSGTTSNEDEAREGDSNTGFSSLDSDSSWKDPILETPLEEEEAAEEIEKLVPRKALPKKGKLLQAVMEAGPLLQTLLVAGQLPQWQHPPPQLNSIDIPPFTITSPMPWILNDKKRQYYCEASHSSSKTKFQKVAHQSPLTNH